MDSQSRRYEKNVNGSISSKTISLPLSEPSRKPEMPISFKMCIRDSAYPHYHLGVVKSDNLYSNYKLTLCSHYYYTLHTQQ